MDHKATPWARVHEDTAKRMAHKAMTCPREHKAIPLLYLYFQSYMYSGDKAVLLAQEIQRNTLAYHPQSLLKVNSNGHILTRGHAHRPLVSNH